MNEWLRAAGIRAIKTMAQTAIATIGGITLDSVEWQHLAFCVLTAGVLSLLTSIAGLPELKGGKKDATDTAGADSNELQ